MKWSYCIAFSVDGATDVTKRYVRKAQDRLARTRASEDHLNCILTEICKERRRGFSRSRKIRLLKEDRAESKELLGYVVTARTTEFLDSVRRSSTIGEGNEKEQKRPTRTSSPRGKFKPEPLIGLNSNDLKYYPG